MDSIVGQLTRFLTTTTKAIVGVFNCTMLLKACLKALSYVHAQVKKVLTKVTKEQAEVYWHWRKPVCIQHTLVIFLTHIFLVAVSLTTLQDIRFTKKGLVFS